MQYLRNILVNTCAAELFVSIFRHFYEKKACQILNYLISWAFSKTILVNVSVIWFEIFIKPYMYGSAANRLGI